MISRDMRTNSSSYYMNYDKNELLLLNLLIKTTVCNIDGPKLFHIHLLVTPGRI